jgi:hypothetical protein
MLAKSPLTSHNRSLRNVIKSVFNVDLHHSPIKVQVEEGLDAKNNSHIISKNQYSKLVGGIGVLEMAPEAIG